MEELEKLREAHTTIVSMIRNHHLEIEEPKLVREPTFVLHTEGERKTRFSDIIMCGRGEKNHLDSSRGSTIDQETLTKQLLKNEYL